MRWRGSPVSHRHTKASRGREKGSPLATPKRVRESFPRSLQHTFLLFHHGPELQHEVIPEPITGRKDRIDQSGPLLRLRVGSAPPPPCRGWMSKRNQGSAREEKGGMTDRCQLISKNILLAREIICSRHGS